MRIIRFTSTDGDVRLGLIADEAVYDLSAAGMAASLKDLLEEGTVAEHVARFTDWVNGARPAFELGELLERGRQSVGDGEVYLLPPIDAQEVWAAGVTYRRSEEARKAESQGAAAFYARVYDADRPELFFKATPHRTVGSHQPVGIRFDSEWDVPEPELGVVLTRDLEPFGYTVGNDMSSRQIEGQNPLYLPQAKVYRNSCALGPAITLAPFVADPHRLDIVLRIFREGRVLYEGQTTTAAMRRRIDELVAYLGRANEFPHGVVLLTGTGIVPSDDVSLAEGDVVEIDIAGLGRLINPVVRVR